MPGNFCSGRHRQVLSAHGRRKAAGNPTTRARPWGLLTRFLPAKNFERESDEPTSKSQSKFPDKSQPVSNPTQRLHHGSRRHQKVTRHSLRKEVEFSMLTHISQQEEMGQGPEQHRLVPQHRHIRAKDPAFPRLGARPVPGSRGCLPRRLLGRSERLPHPRGAQGR
jgi:hypothetical protein